MLAKGPGFAVYAILDFVADNFQPIIEQLEDEFDVLEEGIFKSDFDRLAHRSHLRAQASVARSCVTRRYRSATSRTN